MVNNIHGMKIMNNGHQLVSVDVAIKLLRPKAKFELYNKIFTKWDHPQDPPSWDEIEDMMKKIESFVANNDLPEIVIVE